jgi:hypothetical protein
MAKHIPLQESGAYNNPITLPADATKFLNGTGAFTVPAGTSTGTVTNTGTLTNHALVKGNGGVDVSALGSLGTTTTLLRRSLSESAARESATASAPRDRSNENENDGVGPTSGSASQPDRAQFHARA